MDVRAGAARHNPQNDSRSGLFPLSFESWHGLCREIGTGGLHCPDLTQRRQALFSFGGAVRLVAYFGSASGLFRPVPAFGYCIAN